MVDSFSEGFEYFRKNASGIVGATDGAEFGLDRMKYVGSVENEINKFEGQMEKFAGMKTSDKILKGNVAEFWHANTFNVDSAINGSSNRMKVLESNKFASHDVEGINGLEMNIGLKYYANSEASAKAQAISVFQKFKEYQSHGGNDGLTKYLKDRYNDNIDEILNDPIYSGQIRVIPSDQLEDATNWLEKMTNTEAARRPEQVKRYQETSELLRDRISDDKGNESTPLSKEDAEKLAGIAKKGEFDASKYGIKSPEVLNFELVMKASLKAGMSAAVISLILKVGPEIYRAIDYLVKNGEIDEDQFKKIGFATINGSSEGFIRGSVAAAITTCCKVGLLGETLKAVSPSVIGAVTVLTINALKGAYGIATNKKTRAEMTDELIKDMFVSAFSLSLGGLSQAAIEIPIVGYLIGSLVGSVIGSFVYNTSYSTAISFCIDSGFTMFGIVEQDYSLPEYIIQKIGVDILEYETFIPESFKPEVFNFDSFEIDTIEPEGIGIEFLRRGVIGIRKIGYIE